MPDLTQYADRDQLAQYGLPSNVLSQIPVEDQDAQLRAATRVARSYLLAQYEAPIEAVGLDVTQAVCAIASWTLMVHHLGINPGTVAHESIKLSHDDAMRWLRDVAAGKARADVTDSTPDVADGGVVIYSETSRGWGSELP